MADTVYFTRQAFPHPGLRRQAGFTLGYYLPPIRGYEPRKGGGQEKRYPITGVVSRAMVLVSGAA